MPRTWKSALAPLLAGIPERTGFAGEFRFGLLNDIRFGEKKLPRMIDRCGALALPKGAALPADWPKPELNVPAQEAAEWRAARGLPDDGRPVVAFAPGAVGPSKRWPVTYFAELARKLTAEGLAVWVLGSPAESAARRRDRRRRRPRRARPHLAGSSQRHPGAEVRQRLRVERFRPRSCRRRHRHADHRHLRADQPVALGAAQSARRGDRNPDRRALPALPQADLPAHSSPLHARHPGRPGAARGAARAWPTRLRPPEPAPRPDSSLPGARHGRSASRSRPRSFPPLAAGGRARVGRRQIRRRDRRHRRTHRRRR